MAERTEAEIRHLKAELSKTVRLIDKLIGKDAEPSVEDDEGPSGIAGLYAKFRGSPAFLITLAVIVGFWVVWNLFPGLPHFDDGEFGRLNLCLSTEASLSVALLIMANDKNDAVQRRQIRYMIAALDAMRSVVRKNETDVRRSDG